MKGWFMTTVSSLMSHRDDSLFRVEKKQRMMELIEQGPFDSYDDFKIMMTNLEEIDSWENVMMKEDAANHLPRRISRLYRQFLGAGKVLGLLKEYARSCGFLYEENGRNVADFAIVFETKKSFGKKKTKLQDAQYEKEKNTSLRLICLNAALVFNEIKRKCSSIVLTSGGRRRGGSA